MDKEINIVLPGQVPRLQFVDSMLFPVQVLPPLDGGGSVHVLLRCFVPTPHDTEQLL